MIDKQRISAVRKVEELGYTFAAGDWIGPTQDAIAPSITDGLHAMLATRADELMGCTAGSPEEAGVAAITDAIEAYETMRWPKGNIEGGKGSYPQDQTDPAS